MTRLAIILVLASGPVQLVSAQNTTPDRKVDKGEGPTPDDSGPASKTELFEHPRALLQPGTNVHLENMVVRAKSGLMVRLASGKREIYAAPLDPSSLQFLALGSRVDVRGTLVEAPSVGQAMLAFAMSAHEARRLAHSRVYVDAWSVSSR
jgi:hypothetical protein